MIYDQFPSKVLPVQLFLTDSAMAQAMAAIPPYTPMLLYRNNNIIVIKTFPSSFLCKSRYMNLLHGSLFMWKTYNFSENSV